MTDSVVLIGDAYAFHGTDIAWMDFLRNFDKRAFLHTGSSRYPHDYAHAQAEMSEEDFFSKFKSFFGEVDVLFARFSHFSKWIDIKHLSLALEILKPRVFVLGYHCHLSKPLENERYAFSRADAFVLLNNRQKEYFFSLYELEGKPYFLLRSLYLPRRAWFAEYPGYRDNAHFGLGGQTIRRTGRFSIKPFLANLMAHLKNGQASATIFGNTAEINNENYLQEALETGRVTMPGMLDAKSYHKYLVEMIRFGSLNGFSDPSEVEQFDKENYPIRMSSYIKANVVPISVRFGYVEMNRIMEEDGFGFVFDEYQEIPYFLSSRFNYKQVALNENRWSNICEVNSLDYFSEGLKRFLTSLA